MTRIHVSMPEGFLADLYESAKEMYVSRSDYIRIALMEKMGRQNLVSEAENKLSAAYNQTNANEQSDNASLS